MNVNCKFENIDSCTADFINEFICDKLLARRTNTTIKNYIYLLNRFFSEFEKSIEAITSDDVLSWIERHYLNKAPRTKYNAISILATFFNYCVSEEYIEKTPIKKYWRPKLPKSLPKYLDKSEHAKIKIKTLSLSLRDRTIIEFLDSSGVRRSELVSLNVDDINLTQRTARIIGKGGKERIVNFSETCAFLLKTLIESLPTDTGAIFLSKRGKRMTPESIYQLTRKIGSDAGLIKKLGPHVFRHTFATELAAKGADLEFISEELGHTSLNTTKIYARIPSNELFNIYEKYMG